MRELNLNEVEEISGGKFKFHFNIFQAVFTLVAATCAGGPVGFGYAAFVLIGAQGAGNLYDMAVEEQR